MRCADCGAEFTPPSGKGRFCSARCASHYRYWHRPGRPSFRAATCMECGAEFREPMRRGAPNRLCPGCREPVNPARESARHESRRRREERAARDAEAVGLEAYHIGNYTEAIMAAKRQPSWCSDARWRIELSRRADPGRFESLPENPFPQSL